MKSKNLKRDRKMLDKLKDNLASIAALIAAVVAIGGGFVKYGEITTKLEALESAGGTDWSAQIAVLEEKVAALDTEHSHTQIKINETKIKLLENSIAEIKAASSNPLAN